MSTAVWLPKRELMEGRLRRVSALSMMSSWTSVAVCRNSMTVAMRTTFGRAASPPAARGRASGGARREQRERGPDALAARSAQVVADVGDDLDVRARLPLELLLDERQLARDEAEDAPRRQERLFDSRGVAGWVHKRRVQSAECRVMK